MSKGKVFSIKDKAELTPDELISLPSISSRRQARIRKVQDLHLFGMRTSEIALFFGLTRRQINNDLQAAKRINRVLVESIDTDAFLGREIRFLERIRRKAMRDYELCIEGGAVKIGFMRTALTAHEKLVKLLQESGLLDKVPERFSIEIPFEDPEVRKAYLDFLSLARERGEKNLGL